MNWRLFWRWALRDLKARWIQVSIISLIIALGTSIFTGLGGQETWRTASHDLSYSKLNMYDVHVELANGSYLSQADVEAALAEIDGIATIETRLIVPTQVDATQNGDEIILVKGELVGVDVEAGGPHVNGVYVNDGRALTEADTANPAALIEYKFAKFYNLQPGDSLKIAGNVELDFVGTGQSPEYFFIMPEPGSFFAQSSFAVLFLPLETVQNITGQVGMVNDVVILVEDGADRDAVMTAVEDVFATQFADVGIQTNFKEEDPVYTLLYNDPKNDQAMWNMISIFFLMGAALAAFNLAGRMVQSQRREIGIAMALGVPRYIIALRPMLVGLQIAGIGTLFGVILGLVFNQVFATFVKEFAPLPYWDIKFHYPSFIKGTLIGIGLPFVATLIPTWRAIRVAPIDAIRSGHLVAKQGGLSTLLKIMPVPGKSFSQMPFRNIFRSPWRSAFTVLGVAVAVALLVMFVGVADSTTATLLQTGDAYEHQSPDRINVRLDNFYPAESDIVQNIVDDPTTFPQWEGQLELYGTLSNGDTSIDSALTLFDLDSDIWVPKLLEGQLDDGVGTIVIAEKMAQDLDVEVGDTVTVKHPRREGELAFGLVETEFRVVAIHDNPLRPITYLDMNNAQLMGLDGVINQVVIVPNDTLREDEAKALLFNQPGVRAIQPINDFMDGFEEGLALMQNFMNVIKVIVIFLAFLIAFNSTSINVDERVREIATMFAFGLPLRTVTRMQIVENTIIGIMGTVVGFGMGWLMLQEMLGVRLEEQLADMKFIIEISPATMLVSLLMGILVVAFTPLLSIRKMLKMNIPNALRVME